MRSQDEYEALLKTILDCLKWDNPEENPYYKWLESQPTGKEANFPSFVKDLIEQFYRS